MQPDQDHPQLDTPEPTHEDADVTKGEDFLAPVTGFIHEGLRAYDKAEYAEAEAFFRQAAEILPPDVALPEPDGGPLAPEHAVERATIALNLGLALDGLGRLDEAVESYRLATILLERLVDDGRRDVEQDWASALGTLASALENQGNGEEAIEVYRKVCAIHDCFFQGGDTAQESVLAGLRINLAYLLRENGHPEDAVSEYRLAIQAYQRMVIAGHTTVRADLALGWTNLGITLDQLQHLDEAVQEYRRAVTLFGGLVMQGRKDLLVDEARARYNYAGALDVRGQREDAAHEYHHVVWILETLIEQDEANREYLPELALSRYNLGGVLDSLSRWNEAVRQYRTAVVDYEFLVADGHTEKLSELANTRVNLGSVLGSQGRFDLAVPEFECAIAIDTQLTQQGWNERAFDLIDARVNLGVALLALGRPDSAVEQFTEVTVLYRAILAEGPTGREIDFGHSLIRLGLALVDLKQYEQALTAFQEAGEVYQALCDAGNADAALDQALSQFHWAKALLLYRDPLPAEERVQAQAALDHAEAELARCVAEGQAELESDLALVLSTAGHLARACGDWPGALQRHQDAAQIIERLIWENHRKELIPTWFRLMFHWAMSHEALGQFEEASALYRQLLTKTAAEPREVGDPAFTEIEKIALAADVNHCRIRLASALEAGDHDKEAIHVYRQLEPPHENASAADWFARAGARGQLGALLLERGQTEPAREEFTQAVLLHQHAIKIRDAQPSASSTSSSRLSDSLNLDLIRDHACLARIAASDAQWELALGHCRSAEDCLGTRPDLDLDLESESQWMSFPRHRCAAEVKALTGRVLTGLLRLEEALEFYHHALVIQESLISQGDFTQEPVLAETLTAKGILLGDLGRHEEAVQSLRRAALIRQRLVVSGRATSAHDLEQVRERLRLAEDQQKKIA